MTHKQVPDESGTLQARDITVEEIGDNNGELTKLAEMLTEAGIPFGIRRNFVGPILGYFGHGQLNEGNPVCTAIYGFGQEEGLLEIMGLLTEEELKTDRVKGYLGAAEVFDRIRTHYRSS